MKLLFVIFSVMFSLNLYSQMEGGLGDDPSRLIQDLDPGAIQDLRRNFSEFHQFQDSQLHEFNRSIQEAQNRQSRLVRMYIDGIDLEMFGVTEITLRDGSVVTIEELEEFVRNID